MEEKTQEMELDFATLRWTIMVDEIAFKALQDNPNYKIEASMKNSLNDNYYIVEIIPDYEMPDIEAMDDEIEDVFADTDALAIHEPFTNCVFVTEDSLETLSDEIYSWNGAGGILLGDMLTDLERLAFILKFFNEKTKYKETVSIKDLKIIPTKDGDPISMEDHADKLFDDIYGVQYKDEEIVTLWWPYIMEGCGMFVAVIKEERDYPLVPFGYEKIKPSPWDDDDDDYYYYHGGYNYYDDYDERFYGRT